MNYHASAQGDGHPGVDTTLDRVVKLIEEAFGRSFPTQIHAETRFEEDLGIDRLGFALVIGVVEIAFGVTLPDAIAERMRAVGDLVTWLDRQQAVASITS